MIKHEFLIPECYVNPVPLCDNCNIKLENQNVQYLSDPPLNVYKCPRCNKEYTFTNNEISGYWKWRRI